MSTADPKASVTEATKARVVKMEAVHGPATEYRLSKNGAVAVRFSDNKFLIVQGAPKSFLGKENPKRPSLKLRGRKPLSLEQAQRALRKYFKNKDYKSDSSREGAELRNRCHAKKRVVIDERFKRSPQLYDYAGLNDGSDCPIEKRTSFHNIPAKSRKAILDALARGRETQASRKPTVEKKTPVAPLAPAPPLASIPAPAPIPENAQTVAIPEVLPITAKEADKLDDKQLLDTLKIDQTTLQQANVDVEQIREFIRNPCNARSGTDCKGNGECQLYKERVSGAVKCRVHPGTMGLVMNPCRGASQEKCATFPRNQCRWYQTKKGPRCLKVYVRSSKK